MVNLTGALVPLVTPFTDDGSDLSEVRLARLVRRHVAEGAAGFAVCTELGEFTTISFSERKRLLELTLRECQGALPVLTHVSTLSTSASLDLTQHAARHGARAAILMPPYYGCLSQPELIEHIRCVAAYAGFPIIVADPMGQLTAASREHLATLQGVTVALALDGLEHPASDWFEADSLSVSPITAFPSTNAQIFSTGQRSAIAKALYEADGLEVGRPRMPVRPYRLPAESAT
jgi:hypothetical protein